MTTLSQDFQNFLDSDDLPLSRQLAERLIEQMGGEEYFIRRYPKINRYGAATGFKGISSVDDVLTFFDANRIALYDFAGVHGAKHCMGNNEYIKEVINRRDFDINRVVVGLAEKAGDDITDCSEERMLVAHRLIWNAVEHLSSAYDAYMVAKTAN